MSFGLILAVLVTVALAGRRSRLTVRLMLPAAVIAAVVVYARQQTGAETASTEASGRVLHVTDGDTLSVATTTGRVRVRLLGIDAPESSTTRYGRLDCGGSAAKASLVALAPAGSRVRLATDPESGDTTDRYGRWLAYVDGRRGDLGEAQLAAGQAIVYRYHSRRFSRLARYERAQELARTHHRGAWSACHGDFHTPRP